MRRTPAYPFSAPSIFLTTLLALVPNSTWAGCGPDSVPVITANHAGDVHLKDGAVPLPHFTDGCMRVSKDTAYNASEVVEVWDPAKPNDKSTVFRDFVVSYGDGRTREEALKKAADLAASGAAKLAHCRERDNSGSPPTIPDATPGTSAGSGSGPASSPAASAPVPVPPPGTPERQAMESTGGTYNGEGMVRPANRDALSTLANAVNIAGTAHGKQTLRSALQEAANANADAERDQQMLSNTYKNMTLPQLSDAFGRAQRNLSEMVSDLEKPHSLPADTTAADEARFMNTLRNARDKAAAGKELLAEMPAGTRTAPSEHPLGKTPELQDLFPQLPPRSPDAYADRMLMLAGLSDDARDVVFSKLALAEKLALTQPNGTKKILSILRNDPKLSKKAPDCAQFLASALQVESRKALFTGRDFAAMWSVQRSRKFPDPPKWRKERAAQVAKVADGFTAVNLYLDEKPAPGDLLVYQLPWRVNSAVFLIESYNPKTMVARVLESTPRGTFRERDLPLSVDAEDLPVRFVRPGLLNLRLKADNNAACNYKQLVKDAANEMKGGGQ